MFGFHVEPNYEYGTLQSRAGVLLAGVVDFDVKIAGRGGHAAMPHLSKDAVVASSAIVLAVQVTNVSSTLILGRERQNASIYCCSQHHKLSNS